MKSLASVQKIVKQMSHLLPESSIKEYLKCLYFNICTNEVKFAKRNEVYLTYIDGVELISLNPLYYLVKHIYNYQYYYKVNPGDTIIDAGAHNGILTTFFAKKSWPDGHVFAFEPDRTNFGKMQDHIILNDCQNQVTTSDLLIWDKTTELEFCESGDVSSSVHYFKQGMPIVKKRAISLDEWATRKKIGKIDFIKMDIEGAEIEAIRGMIDILTKFKPNLAIASYHVVDGAPTHLYLEDFFRKINYPYKTRKFENSEIITFAGPAVE